MTAETEIANILDKARQKLINLYDTFPSGGEIYGEYNDKLVDLIIELDYNFFYPQYNPYSEET